MVFSLLVHLLVLALLVLSVKPRQREEEFVPPAQVAMIFEHGGAAHKAAPRSRLHGPPEQPHPAALPHPLARVSPPRPVQRTLPAPAHLALARPVPSPVRPAPSAPRRPPPQPPSEQQYAVRLEPNAEMQALLQPPPLPAPRPFVPLPVPPVPPRHVPPAPPPPAAPHYLVMNNMSYGAPPPGASAGAPAPPSAQAGGLNLALNESVMRNAFARQFTIQGNIGPDWRAELTQWVNERKYYPEQAVEMDQQGAVMIRLIIERDGTVRDATLLQSSGSPFLDQAWLGLFQGARLPPFPPGTPSDQITLEATMHYILVN
ncbi:MAG TPA: energy transducer TonB [Acetobacteraceae bacterium]|nr:energy transducer TonB [Acetobacteraceae bacterium]